MNECARLPVGYDFGVFLGLRINYFLHRITKKFNSIEHSPNFVCIAGICTWATLFGNQLIGEHEKCFYIINCLINLHEEVCNAIRLIPIVHYKTTVGPILFIISWLLKMQFLLLVSTLLVSSAMAARPQVAGPHVEDSLCIGKANGQKVATSTCNSFVTCNGGIAVTESCEQGKLFNVKIEDCDWARNVNCTELIGAPQGAAPNCQGRIGQMLRNPYDCSSFYFCEHNQALLFHCDSGLYFDTKINNCNWKESVVCRIDDLPMDPDAPVSTISSGR